MYGSHDALPGQNPYSPPLSDILIGKIAPSFEVKSSRSSRHLLIFFTAGGQVLQSNDLPFALSLPWSANDNSKRAISFFY